MKKMHRNAKEEFKESYSVPRDVLRGEKISATLKAGNLLENVTIWKINPFGIEIKKTKDLTSFEKIVNFKIQLFLQNQELQLTGTILNQKNSNQDEFYSIIFTNQIDKRISINKNPRESKRFSSHKKYYPTAYAQNPFEYNDIIYFKVENISNNGFFLSTSLRNKLIIKGVQINCTFEFPMSENIDISLKVTHVSVLLENNELGIGVKIINPSQNIKEKIGQYLFQFGKINSILDFKKDGYEVKTYLKGVDFRFVKSEEDYQEVLKLRYLAYSSSGKIKIDENYLSMQDKFDEKARIVIGVYNGNIIASARLIFHKLGDKFEQEEFIEWEKSFPLPQNSIEVSRVCVDPSYQKKDILLGLFRFNTLTAVQSKREYVVISATDKMASFYQKIGFQITNKHYPLPTFNNVKHNVCFANIRQGITGKNCNPIYWNIVWADVTKYISESYDDFDLDFTEKIRMALYSLLNPISNHLKNKVRKK